MKFYKICSAILLFSNTIYGLTTAAMARNVKQMDRNQVSEKGNKKSTITWFDDYSMLTTKQATGLSRFLSKVRKGKLVVAFVIGGSNTAGGGISGPGLSYFAKLVKKWNKSIYKTTGSKLNAYSSAIGGCGSDFYSMCFQNFLPHQMPDIVLVEQAINDNGITYGKAAQPMEILTRSLLLLSSNPLVMYVNIFNPNIINNTIRNTKCKNMENMGFSELAMHYGIPSFSLKDFACVKTADGKYRVIKDNLDLYSKDGTHAGVKAHNKLAAMMVEYFTKALNEIDEDVNLPTHAFSLPRPVFSDPSIEDGQLVGTRCYTTLSPDWKHAWRQTLDGHVTTAHGFKYISPYESQMKVKLLYRSKWYSDARSGWETKRINGTKVLTIRFSFPTLIPTPIPGTASGSVKRSAVAIIRLTERKTTFRLSLNDKQNSCIYVDQPKLKARHTGTRLYPVSAEVSPGNYTLTMESYKGVQLFAGIAIGYRGYHRYEGYHFNNETITKC